MKHHFYKMQGCGNDFLFLDCLEREPVTVTPAQVVALCDRHFGIGADGVAILSKGKTAQAKWDFFNSDGSRAEMCGNAARCAIRFLAEKHFGLDDQIQLETAAGVITGKLFDDKSVEIVMVAKGKVDLDYEDKVLRVEENTFELFCVNTGVPHAVLEVNDIRTYPIAKVGRGIQAHPAFQPEGTNVTYYQRVGATRILSTSFERGVEAETFACGTGAAAAAVIFANRYLQKFPIEVKVPGGTLHVGKTDAGALTLRGPAEYVFEVDAALPTGAATETPTLYGDRKGRS